MLSGLYKGDVVLHEIQVSLLQEGSKLGPILLKLRFLAARLGSDVLEEWVKHELDGYPFDTPVPDYRVTSISYSGNFTNGYWVINETDVPSAVIKKLANESWVNY